MENGKIVVLGDVVSGGIIKKNRAVCCEGAVIRSIVSAETFPVDDFKGTVIRAPNGQLVTASFIDLQVNGAGGACFQSERSLESLETIERALGAYGVGYFAPTVTSSDLETYRSLRNTFREFAAQHSSATAINFEGPFVNRTKGGMHNSAYIREMDETFRDIYYDLLDDTRVIITMAPEVSNPKLVVEMVQDGVIISAGHTTAGAGAAEAFFDLGVSNVTHVFNGMPTVAGREPGLTGLALARPDIFCSLIADGHHLHPEIMNLIWRLKGSNRVYLISDGMPHLGAEVGLFKYENVEIRDADGALVDAEGTLCGTKVPINRMAHRLAQATGARPEKILSTITSVPAAVLRRDREIGDVRPGMRASLNIVDRAFEVQFAMREGDILLNSLEG